MIANSNNFDFSKKHILIVGAANGIGKETSIQLARLGAILSLADINEEQLLYVIEQLPGDAHQATLLDMSQPDSIEVVVNDIIQKKGPIDGLINCVGIRSRRPIALLTPTIVSEVMTINFISFVELIRVATKKKNFNGQLNVVGVSSIAAVRGGAGVTAYAASKGALESAVRCLAKELAPKNIRLNLVAPAQVSTQAYDELMKQKDTEEDPILKRQYLGLSNANDIASVIMFLLSDHSRMITGSTIPVDGGFLTT